jgi:hypothetical protein
MRTLKTFKAEMKNAEGALAFAKAMKEAGSPFVKTKGSFVYWSEYTYD